MPLPVVTLPPCEHDTAFAAIVGFLRRDPVLNRYVKTWQVWAGTPKDGDAAVPEACPLLRITPVVAGGCKRFDNTTHYEPFDLVVELVVPGNQALALTRFWAQVRRVLFPSDPTVAATFDAAMQAAGVTELHIRSAPTGLIYSPDPRGPAQVDLGMAVGIARIGVDLYTQTQPTPS